MVDAFDMPRFAYHHVRKILSIAPHQRSLHGDANAKVSSDAKVPPSIQSSISLCLTYAVGDAA
jgi:hypothetical protein